MIDHGIISEMISSASSGFVSSRIEFEFSPGSASALPREEAANYKWVAEVSAEQRQDGSWGRFHSMNSKLKQKWPTTESAMSRLKYLGLDISNPSVEKACKYCETLLNDISLWPDAMERNKLFPRAVPIYITTALSHFGSEDRLYKQVRDNLLLLLHKAFAGGQYDADALNAAAKEHLGIETHDTYIGLSSKYFIIFFCNNVSCIDRDVQRQYLAWLHRQDTVYYSSGSLKQPITPLSNIRLICERAEFLWYLSAFTGFAEEFAQDLNALFCLRRSDGYWDFGAKLGCPRLSESWAKPMDRKIDQTFYLLRLYKNRE